jgi:hypothetical protein
MTSAGYLPAVTAVEVIGEHELRPSFDDGTVGGLVSRTVSGSASSSRCAIRPPL